MLSELGEGGLFADDAVFGAKWIFNVMNGWMSDDVYG